MLQFTLVLGNHRSGTSLLTAGLQAIGCDLGRLPDERDADNPRGYFENHEVRCFNDRLLARLGTAWDDWTFYAPSAGLDGPDLEPLRQEAAELLRHCFPGPGPFALKDPRVTMLLPFWMAVLDALGWTQRHVLILRHPDEVAESQMQRVARRPLAFPRLNTPEVTCALWAVTMHGALSALPAAGVLAVRHDALLADPAGVLADVAGYLGLVPDPARVEGYALDFLDTTLYRAHPGAEPGRSPWCDAALRLWRMAAPTERTGHIATDRGGRIACAQGRLSAAIPFLRAGGSARAVELASERARGHRSQQGRDDGSPIQHGVASDTDTAGRHRSEPTTRPRSRKDMWESEMNDGAEPSKNAKTVGDGQGNHGPTAEKDVKVAKAAPESKTYQTHRPDAKGMSASEQKLRSLSLPAHLDGFRVLDIGCNEGFFCKEASRRGASLVLGIDVLPENISAAGQFYGDDPKIKFIRQSWHTLPEGPFDLILWTSAMHYERDPLHILNQIHSRLSPDGLFVFEGGITQSLGRSYELRSRMNDTCYYPTMDYMLDVLLKDFGARVVGGPYYVEGDGTPRYVIHCRRRQRTVILISGETGSGKTNLARALGANIDNVISLDVLVWRIVSSKFHHTPLEKLLAKADMSALGKTYEEIAKNPQLCKELADWVSRHTPQSDRTLIIEGYMPQGISDAIKAAIGPAFFWECKQR